MPPHLLDPRVLEPLAPFLAALEQADRASLSLACKALFTTVLAAGSWRCTVHKNHLASFTAWLGKLQAAGGCAGLAVKLWGRTANAGKALATLRRLAAAGPTELKLKHGITDRLERAQQLLAIQELGASKPCRLRTLCIRTDASILPAIDAITTLERLECTAPADDTEQWQPNLPQLTALDVAGGTSFELDLNGVPALQQLILQCGNQDAYVCIDSPPASLTALRFSGAGMLFFPWQQARRLRELVLYGDDEEPLGQRAPASVVGIGQLAALKKLRSLTLELPRNELPVSTNWLRRVTTLNLHITADERGTGIDQALDIIAGAPKLAALHITDENASGWYVMSKWALMLLGKVPDSLQSASVFICVNRHGVCREDELGVVRQAGECTAAMLGRLAAEAISELDW